ncbi:Cell division cycle-associated 7-like protein [Carex littledalei]|uniref:Cell division cycle-associated 7-like protein n=1 Tax=Carex littledalei TaxID=544730 RepID=A0A833QUK9_9POAL|nr:Cell division cycle-associated 7-like protein [Carex littledalei]
MKSLQVKKEHGLVTAVRRSSRLNALSSSKDEIQSPVAVNLEEKDDSKSKTVERFGEKCDYESIRNARISENMARMESLGLLHAARELNQIISSSPKSNKANKPKWKDRKVELTPTRRSSRLKAISSNKGVARSLSCISDFEEKLVVFEPDRRARVAWRCESKGRGSVYDPILGICCHFCRQKKLCGEEDCKRCGDGDTNQPCIGKTECSVCHSTNGILCRACLKVRYGEEMEDVRKNKEWMCPHCVEEMGVNPFWICNSSFCMKKRKLVPTGIAIYEEKEYKLGVKILTE